MGKAVLIYGGTYRDRIETLKSREVVHSENTADPDLLIIEKDKDRKSIGIASSREIKKFLQEKPLNKKKKIVVVTAAELMTIEAQNALLKIIEEPPSYAEIYLLTKTENSLLDTVISRCVKKKAEKFEESTGGNEEIYPILEMTLGQRLDKAKDISDLEKEEITDTLEGWVLDLRTQTTPQEYPGVNIQRVRKIIATKKLLEDTNVNQRLALEALLLDL